MASGFTTAVVGGLRREAALVSQRDTGRSSRSSGTAPASSGGSGVAPGGEGGLLGIAHAGGYLYTYATTIDGNRVMRFPLDGAPGSFALGAAQTVVDGIPSARIHNGGRIAFGPDGMLYITAGDAADPARAQDLESLGGKILRVTPRRGARRQPVPRFAGVEPRSSQPAGIGWDAAGTMFASEFGQNTWDELNVIEPGANYGWPESRASPMTTAS